MTNYLQPKHWPEVPMERGKFYDVNDPMYQGTRIVCMLSQTWIDFGTMIESQKRTMETQHKTILELKTRNEVLEKMLADLERKHRNLTKAYKRDKRHGIVKALGPKTVAEIEAYEAEQAVAPQFNPLST